MSAPVQQRHATPVGALRRPSPLISSEARIGHHVVLGEGVRISPKVQIGDNVTIAPGVKISTAAVVLPDSEVVEDVRGYTMVAGRPAQTVRLLERPYPEGVRENPDGSIKARPESDVLLGDRALEKILADYDISTVLDIGSGAGRHADRMEAAGKKVTRLDFGSSMYFAYRPEQEFISGDYLKIGFEQPFDCLWACHVLEHQPNPGHFLQKMHRDCREGGVVAITVPPLKHTIVGGHLSLWNAGLLLYHLVHAGFDCSEAAVRQYGYNISVVVRKRTITDFPKLDYDYGDVHRLRRYFPAEAVEPFEGNLLRVNWD